MGIMEQTAEFMRIGKQLEEEPAANWLYPHVRVLRPKILTEEYREYMIAEDENDLVETCDGLADIIVVAAGTLFTYAGYRGGMKILDEVGRSNLSKFEIAESGEKVAILRGDGKILKGPHYFRPDIEGILRAENLL